MSKSVFTALWEIQRDGGLPFGQRRLAGRAAEFGLADDVDLARAIADCAIANHFPLMTKEGSAHQYIATTLNLSLPMRGYPLLGDDDIATLISSTAKSGWAWDACHHLAKDYEEHGVQLPTVLLKWLIAVSDLEAPRPDLRTYKRREDLTARNNAIIFTMKLILETSLHETRNDGTDSAVTQSACDIVAEQMRKRRFPTLSYESVSKIWADHKRAS